MSDYPRVLIVGDSISSVSGGGVTLRNLFSLWGEGEVVDLLSFDDVKNGLSWKWKWQTHAKRNTHTIHSKSGENHAGNPHDFLSRRKQDFKKHLFYHITPSYCCHTSILTEDMQNTIKRFAPDLMYFQPAPFNLDLLCKLHRLFPIPYVVHFLDDWISLENSRRYLLRYFVRKYLYRKLLTIVGHASGYIGIGEDMANQYGKLFGKKFTYFHNPVDIDLWNTNCSEENISVNTPFKILYSGKIGTGVSSSLQKVSSAVEKLCDSGMHGSFHITTGNIDRATDLGLDRYLCKWCAYKELPKFVSSHDILVLPFDFDHNSINLRGLSIPTKLSEYMATGVPILIFAPENLSITKLARRDGWAHIVSENRLDILVREIRILLTDSELRSRISNCAVNHAKTNHSLGKVRVEFSSYLKCAASRNASLLLD